MAYVSRRLHRHWDRTPLLKKFCKFSGMSFPTSINCLLLVSFKRIIPYMVVQAGPVELAKRWHKTVWVYDQEQRIGFLGNRHMVERHTSDNHTQICRKRNAFLNRRWSQCHRRTLLSFLYGYLNRKDLCSFFLQKFIFANTTCPLQKTTQSHFSIELPVSEEGSRIKGTCSHRDNPVSQPVYADYENGNWQKYRYKILSFF